MTAALTYPCLAGPLTKVFHGLPQPELRRFV
jgi:hypothetical protein